MSETATTSWHSYPSIFALGHRALTELLLDPVIVEEKLDGSQFSFGRFDGELKVRSKGQVMHADAPEKMFQRGVDAIRELPLHDGWTYRGEYLQKPKHNSLAYARTPERHVMLFDINTGHEEYLEADAKRAEAERLGLECVPILHVGAVASVADVHGYLERESVLGGTLVEGVVIKNYRRFGADKKALMGKYVSERFKEVHAREWKVSNPTRADVVEGLIASLRTDARWDKAVQHLRDAGKLESSPRDIGVLIKDVPEDILNECADEIRDALFQWAWPQIRRGVTRGLPEWYKERLLAQQFETESA